MPVRIEVIHARRLPPRSEITVGQDYSQRLPATKDYDLFVSNAGPLGQAFGSFGRECFRLQVEAAFDDGNSWELACFIAHALARHGRFAAAGEEVDEIIMASGRVDLAFDVGAVEHLELKLDAARETIEDWRGKDVPVTLMLPAQGEDTGSLTVPEGAAPLFCTNVAEVMDHVGLSWKPPKVPRTFPPIRRPATINRWVLVLTLIAALAMVGLGIHLTSRDAAMEAHAEQLLEGLDAQAGGRTLRLALLPFWNSEIPIDKDIADTITDALEQELLRQGRHEIIAHDAIDAIIDDMEKIGGLVGTGNRNLVPELLKRAQGIDIFVKGRVRLVLEELELSFQAVDLNGKLVAASRRQSMPLKACQENAACVVWTLDQAIDNSTRYFVAQAPDLRNLYLGGVRYQDSGAQPPFGRYLQQRVVDSLRLRYDELGADLNIWEVGAAAQISETIPVRTAMLLKGTYWNFADTIELRLALDDTQGGFLVWRGRVRREGFDEVSLMPPRNLGNLRENDGLGPIEFRLSSDRGTDPAYRIGDKINLVIRTDRDAWIYCFYSQADGKILQILPNPAMWKQASEPRLDGGVVHRVPGDSTYPFDLVLSEPPGLELIKCFAFSRDVTLELPVVLQGRAWAPIEPAVVGQMSKIFQDLPKTAVSEASLVVTVMPRSSL
jgi:hypothetical protein